MNAFKIVKYIFLSLRPKQWTKNFLIFAALIFSQKLNNYYSVIETLIGFLIFCIVSGSIYTLNDIIDRDKDKLHPKKAKRPIASGKLPISYAILSFLFFATLGIVSAFNLETNFGWVIVIYIALQILYTFNLKNVVILDIFIIAIGFVLRVVAGAEIIAVDVSSWLLVCTLFLSLFLALGKRRFELIKLDKKATSHRSSLKEYNVSLLDQMITVVTSATVVAYAIYTLSPETKSHFNTEHLIYTLPFVLYGVFRYLYLIYQKETGGNPEEILVTDIPLIIDILLYGVTVWYIIY
ncbi:MAG: phosphoribose diphosphate--decaprenyl-phosphate phosphoribosyltransferase [Candidatus Firestonebacteria bacterium RIFOXYC2_FULL_39_67]|nr:MAG: phosphoribose diphosphate--decaprenyl-phosphate phosphoribosyltransferase [Candidatus Firestonebacteria bacterium RIFOXYD2_FULL_39_29]OGF56628.1 MAG: phosphoribose diphosphate--decaprenyl-phosphate phosphoribosyltransferase [Candidatus Firestonebacteria bacterium RIFOXYC2_FULL_39_67]OGF57104.1 MAG: phosphoribose diphosphate--decaprenyl-phosphate phosphoribosyltransferase [Candidatus Firestonebacteria bacterium RifOxyC12_full_39_7]